jgi:hypothetical protein
VYHECGEYEIWYRMKIVTWTEVRKVRADDTTVRKQACMLWLMNASQVKDSASVSRVVDFRSQEASMMLILLRSFTKSARTSSTTTTTTNTTTVHVALVLVLVLVLESVDKATAYIVTLQYNHW